jgi:putative addiction module antidote
MNRIFDAKLRKVGNSYVVTIPKDSIDRFKLKDGDYIEVSFNPEEVKRKKTSK